MRQGVRKRKVRKRQREGGEEQRGGRKREERKGERYREKGEERKKGKRNRKRMKIEGEREGEREGEKMREEERKKREKEREHCNLGSACWGQSLVFSMKKPQLLSQLLLREQASAPSYPLVFPHGPNPVIIMYLLGFSFLQSGDQDFKVRDLCGPRVEAALVPSGLADMASWLISFHRC